MSHSIVAEDGSGGVVKDLEVFDFAFVAEFDRSKVPEAGERPFDDVSNFSKADRQAVTKPTQQCDDTAFSTAHQVSRHAIDFVAQQNRQST